MTATEVAICALVILAGVVIALVIDYYERKIERARYALQAQSRTTTRDAIDWREVVQQLTREATR